MKAIKVTRLFLVMLCFSCSEEIQIDTSDIVPSIVVDAFINTLPQDQTISITLSRDFNDDQPFSGVDEVDTVYVENLSDLSENPYVFSKINETDYLWVPDDETSSFGILGDTYRLTVVIGELIITAESTLNPVPVVDSIRFNYEDGSGFVDEGFDAEFFATDLEGIGNTYWIKGYKNGVFLDQPEYITTSFDGAFLESDLDGILFIPPIRSAISPLEVNEAGNGIAAPFLVGDSVGVEVHAVTQETFLYLNEIRTQTDRQGGISEIFSVPVTNLTGNLETNTGENVLGFFSTSTASALGVKLTEELAEEAIAKE